MQHQLPPNSFRTNAPLPTAGKHGATFSAAPRGGVSSSQYPSVVAVVVSFERNLQDYNEYCTGTILAPDKVLTAATCTTGLPGATTFVLAGGSSIGATGVGGYVDYVASTWTTPKFNLAALNAGTTTLPSGNATVLTLKTSLPAQYPPITLTAQGDQSPYAPGTSSTLVGYSYGSHGDGILQATTQAIQADTTCAADLPGYSAATMTCAGLPTGSHTVCDGDQGAPLLVGGREAAITSWGSADCGDGSNYDVAERLSAYQAAIHTAVTQPGVRNEDFTGDGHSDLLTLRNDGSLGLDSGSGFVDDGFGGFAGESRIGSGWNQFSTVLRADDWNDANSEAVLAIAPDGSLLDYATSAGAFTGSVTRIGSGWQQFTHVVSADNWFGDGYPALIATSTDGTLWVYQGNGQGGFSNPYGVQIGSGWGGVTTLLAAGDWNGDGHQSLIARTGDGSLHLYETNGGLTFVNPNGVVIGSGWNAFDRLVAPGDWNGDGLTDLIGVTPGGDMELYTTDGHGHWQGSSTELSQIWADWTIF